MKLERVSFVRPGTLILLTLSLFGCDIATKSTAKATLDGADAIAVAPTMLRGALELRYVENDDIAFNALRMLGVTRTPGLLVGLATVAMLFIVIGAFSLWRGALRVGGPSSVAPSRAWPELLMQAGFALVLGGALGNVVDRAIHGYVIDFIHVKGWPVFNVADIAVVLGAGLVILSTWRQRMRPVDAGEPPAA